MPTYDDYTEKTSSTFDGALEFILNDRSDATEAGYCYVTGNDYLTWIKANIKHTDIAATAINTYLATMTFVGFDSSGGANKEITFANLLTSLESADGLDLDKMYASDGKQILSTRKSAIVSLKDSTGGMGTDTLNGYTITGVTDSTGGTTSPTATLVDVGATYSQANINDNFATIATALNAIVSALNGDNDVSSLRDKIEEILGTLRVTGGHKLIEDTP